MKNNYRLESRMRENRPCGSEGGEGQPFPTPIEGLLFLCRAGLKPAPTGQRAWARYAL